MFSEVSTGLNGKGGLNQRMLLQAVSLHSAGILTGHELQTRARVTKLRHF